MANSNSNGNANYVLRDRRDASPSSEKPTNRFYASTDEAIREFSDYPGDFHGVFKPNSFYVRFERPSATSDFDRHLDLFVQSVNIPGKNITSQEVRMYGPVREIPTGVSYSGDIEMRFILSQDFYAYKWIMDWMNTIVGETTANVSYQEDISCRLFISPTVDVAPPKEFVVYNYDPVAGDQAPVTFIVEDVWPKTMSQIELNTSSRNNIAEFTLSLSFRKWHYVSHEEANAERERIQAENKARATEAIDTAKEGVNKLLDFFKESTTRDSLRRSIALAAPASPLNAGSDFVPGPSREEIVEERERARRAAARAETANPASAQNAGSDFNPDFL